MTTDLIVGLLNLCFGVVTIFDPPFSWMRVVAVVNLFLGGVFLGLWATGT